MRTFKFLGPNIASVRANMNGSVSMNDGEVLDVWYFGDGFNSDRQIPSPVIEAIEGETVEVTLSSLLAHSIHFHGLDVDQANDGVGGTSGYVAELDDPSFGRVQGYTNLGSPFTYRFTAPHAGTYMYHCHIDTVLHVERGMVGTVIVRPPNGSSTTAWTGGPTFDLEYIWHLHTFDSNWQNASVSGSQTIRYQPDYFMLNGKDGSQSLNDSTCSVKTDHGNKVLIRAINIGYQPANIDLGGMSFEVIASDGRPLPSPITVTELLITPGERYDILMVMPIGYEENASIKYRDARNKSDIGLVQTQIKDISNDFIFANGFEVGAKNDK